jgi:hypothetical protein
VPLRDRPPYRRHFAEAGANVVVVDTHEDAVEEVTHAPSGTDKRIMLVSESSTRWSVRLTGAGRR